MDGDRALAAEYVLGLLSPADRAATGRRLDSEPALAAEARLWQSRFSGLDAEFDVVAPPSRLLAAIEARAFGDAPKATGLANWWNNLALWRALTAGAAAVAVIALGFGLTRPAPLDPSAVAVQLVAALEQEGSATKFLALYDGATGSVRLTAVSGEAVADRDLELWYIDDTDAPVSMGVIPVSGRTEVPLPREAQIKFEDGTVLAITLEPKGGSPTGAPTGMIVAAGQAVAI
ncbi:MAG: anti-sigma factor [Devosia sp.]|nr:anti-sigma factor [Devosia sp.]